MLPVKFEFVRIRDRESMFPGFGVTAIPMGIEQESYGLLLDCGEYSLWYEHRCFWVVGTGPRHIITLAYGGIPTNVMAVSQEFVAEVEAAEASVLDWPERIPATVCELLAKGLQDVVAETGNASRRANHLGKILNAKITRLAYEELGINPFKCIASPLGDGLQ